MQRSGFTKIELVVTMLVTATLAAVTVPAVRSAKDAENKQKCQARLKVLGGAIAAEVKDHGGFGCTIGTEFVSLFPYIGQQAVYDKWLSKGSPFGRDDLEPQQQIDEHNRFVRAKITIPEFLCPSHIDDRTDLSMNYLWNAGIGPVDEDTGAVCQNRLTVRKLNDFTDGLSNSVVMSETRWATSKRNIRKYDPHDLGVVHRLQKMDLRNEQGYQQFLLDCRVGRNIIAGHPEKGRGWNECGNTITQYHHLFEPFQRSCFTQGFSWGHATASSYHDNGVNVLLADGSVRYVNRFIDLQLWQNLGNRCDGEEIEW